MDSGCSGGDSDDEMFDTTTPLSANEAIWLMDELMYREVHPVPGPDERCPADSL